MRRERNKSELGKEHHDRTAKYLFLLKCEIREKIAYDRM